MDSVDDDPPHGCGEVEDVDDDAGPGLFSSSCNASPKLDLCQAKEYAISQGD